jgi:type II secretory pathway predicted ATPase ExeA
MYHEAFAVLKYGIEARKGFTVVTGEVGTGKTTLLRRLMRHNVGGSIHTAFIFNTNLNPSELLHMIVYELGLPVSAASNKALLLQELNKYVLSELQEGHIVAVLVDEAQNLSDEALESLRLLSNLETDDEKLIQIVLVGQTELEAVLDRPTLRQLKHRIALRCRMYPLTRGEIPPYINFRLRAAGYNGPDLFDSDALSVLSDYSRGIPRTVNIMCDNALLSAFAANQRLVTGDTMREIARDLRLGSEGFQEKSARKPEIGAAESNGFVHEWQAQGQNAADEFTYEFAEDRLNRTNEASEPRSDLTKRPFHDAPKRRRFKIAAGLLILGLGGSVALTEPQHFAAAMDKTLKLTKHNIHRWTLFITKQEPTWAEATAEESARLEKNDYQLASEVYGRNSGLGIDLIKESNPHIRDLSRVTAGQALTLPSLRRETLLRRQVDGSYHLILACFRRQATADEYATGLKTQGYSVAVTPRRITNDLLFYRVEITSLKTLDEANHAWSTILQNEWIVLANSRH